MLNTEIFDLLPDSMRAAVEGLRILHNSPDELAIPAVLQIANFAAQATTNVNPDYWGHMPISTYTVILNKSSGRKSTVLAELTRGIKEFEKEERRRYSIEQPHYSKLHKQWEKEYERAIITGSRIPSEPVKPVGHTYILEKATVNGLIDSLDSVPHCGLINADAAEFFKSHAFQDKGSGRDTEMITTLSKLFSDEKISRQTGIKENNVVIEGRRFCMLAMLQEELADFLTNANYRDQGFTHRLLISVVPDYEDEFVPIAAARKQSTGVRNQYLDPFNDRCRKLLSTVVDDSEDKKATNAKYQTARALLNDSYKASNKCELKLDTMKINSQDVSDKLIDEFNLRTREIKNLPSHVKYVNFMNRRYEHMLRIAATLAKFEGDSVVNDRWIYCAIGLVEWFTEMRVNMDINTNTTSESVQQADELYKWLALKNHVEFNHTTLNRYGPNWWRKLPVDKKHSILNEMASREMIEVVEENGRIHFKVITEKGTDE